MLPFGITVDVLAVSRDRHGDEVLTLAGKIPGCGFAPGSSTEDNDQRAQVVSVGDLYCQPGDVVVTAQHRIRMPGGEVWRVDGEPGRWDRPYSGGSAGVVIHLRRAKG